MKKVILFLLIMGGIANATLTNQIIPVTKNGSINPPTVQNSSISDNGTIVTTLENVGIGTTSTSQVLDVYGNVRGFSFIGTGGGSSFINGNLGIGTSNTPINALEVATGGVTIGTTYATYNTAPSNGIAIQGNVAIGTFVAGQALTVGTAAGGASISSAGAIATAGGYTQSGSSVNNFTGNVGIGSAAPGELVDVEGGNVGIGTHVASAPLVVTGSGNIALTATGNVGIGSTAPGGLLDVEGGNVGIGSYNPGVALDLGAGAIRIGIGTTTAGTILCVKTIANSRATIGYCTSTLTGDICATCN